jgi:hypothetical protein
MSSISILQGLQIGCMVLSGIIGLYKKLYADTYRWKKQENRKLWLEKIYSYFMTVGIIYLICTVSYLAYHIITS